MVCLTEYDRKASIRRRPWPTRGCCAIGKKKCFSYMFKAMTAIFRESLVAKAYIVI
jgi:hypothetical protein